MPDGAREVCQSCLYEPFPAALGYAQRVVQRLAEPVGEEAEFDRARGLAAGEHLPAVHQDLGRQVELQLLDVVGEVGDTAVAVRDQVARLPSGLAQGRSHGAGAGRPVSVGWFFLVIAITIRVVAYGDQVDTVYIGPMWGGR